MPTDLLVPVQLWERANLSSDDFIEITDFTDHDGLPSEPQAQTLRYWEWRADGLYFLGATQDTQIRLRYQTSFPDLVDATSPVLIRNAQEALAYAAAAMAGAARGAPQAERWDIAAIDALEDLLVRATQREQQTGRRRRPFSSRAGFAPLICRTGFSLWLFFTQLTNETPCEDETPAPSVRKSPSPAFRHGLARP